MWYLAVEDAFRGMSKKAVVARYPAPTQDHGGVSNACDPNHQTEDPETLAVRRNCVLLPARGDGLLKRMLASRVGGRRQH